MNINSSDDNANTADRHTPQINNSSDERISPQINNSPAAQIAPVKEEVDDETSVVVTSDVQGQSVKTKYFVSNYYVEKIVDNMKLDQERNMEKIESLLNTLSEKFEVIEELRNNELPEIRQSMDFSQKRITKVIDTQFRNYNLAK